VFRSITGGGVQGEVEGHAVLVGSRRLLQESGIVLDIAEARLQAFEEDGKTALLVAVDGRPVGLVAVADTIKDGLPRRCANCGCWG
jgi:Cu+-exporting ATPase